MYIAAISSVPGHSLRTRSQEVVTFCADHDSPSKLPSKAFYGSKVTNKGRWFEAATPACAWDCAFPPRSYIPSCVRRSALFGKPGRVLLLLLPPPRISGANSAIPARPSGAAPEGLGTARFTKALELKKRRSARCPRVAALVQLHPPKPPPRPAGGSHCLVYHLGRAGGWQGPPRPPEGPIARARQPFRAPH
jgi:hypothetical protein